MIPPIKHHPCAHPPALWMLTPTLRGVSGGWAERLAAPGCCRVPSRWHRAAPPGDKSRGQPQPPHSGCPWPAACREPPSSRRFDVPEWALAPLCRGPESRARSGAERGGSGAGPAAWHTATATCCVPCAVCPVLCDVCHTPCTVCPQRCSMCHVCAACRCPVPHAECHGLCTTSMYPVTSTVSRPTCCASRATLHAVCHMPCTTCRVSCAVCHVPRVCSMCHTLCAMWHSVWHALCVCPV